MVICGTLWSKYMYVVLSKHFKSTMLKSENYKYMYGASLYDNENTPIVIHKWKPSSLLKRNNISSIASLWLDNYQ